MVNEKNEKKTFYKVVGIDLGTTNCCVAVKEGDKINIINNKEGQTTTPSCIAITSSGEILIGKQAKNTGTYVSSTKRFIGRKYEELKDLIKTHSLPYEVVSGSNGDASVKVGTKIMTPVEVAANILRYLKKTIEDYFHLEANSHIIQAVITVPAYFNNEQRKATMDAGEIAGFKVLRIISEPTAAAVAYGFEKNKSGTVGIYDLGGGTFDVSLLNINEGMFEVVSTHGDMFLGGDDFDNRLIKLFLTTFSKQSGVSEETLKSNKMVLQRIGDAAEQAKIELSSRIQTEVRIPFLYQSNNVNHNFEMSITRSQLEMLTEDLLNETIEKCKTAMKNANLTQSQKTEMNILLVGGMTRMPKVNEVVEKFFGKKPSKEINPDQVVAIGAAIQGAILSGEIKDLLLLDVTPFDLGIETLGGVMTKIIKKNSTIPAKQSQVFSTADDNQNAVTIRVCQGDRPMASDNKHLGQFDLIGIPPAPRGIPQIEVTFDIDANGIMKISAKDKATGKEQSVVIHSTGGLSEEEKKRMKEDAEKYAEEDQKKAELIEAKNSATSTLYMANSTLTKYKENVTEEIKTKIEEKITQLNAAIEENNVTEIKSKNEELSALVSEVGVSMYKEAENSNKDNGNSSQEEVKPQDETKSEDDTKPEEN
jgi:molecular chaperone DnaK